MGTPVALTLSVTVETVAGAEAAVTTVQATWVAVLVPVVVVPVVVVVVVPVVEVVGGSWSRALLGSILVSGPVPDGPVGYITVERRAVG